MLFYLVQPEMQFRETSKVRKQNDKLQFAGLYLYDSSFMATKKHLKKEVIKEVLFFKHFLMEKVTS